MFIKTMRLSVHRTALAKEYIMILDKIKKLKFTETALRDAHQSLMATRMRTEEMMPIVKTLDEVGYDSVECWGGATFDVCMRYLDEDPWKRLRKLRDGFKNTKLQMLLRGQNLVGYRHYSDDVVDVFIRRSVANGIDILRIFDALNDMRNVERAVKAAKREGAHVQLAMAYTTGKAYTMKYWKELAKQMADLGADSICIKDMAGLLMPSYAERLVKTVKRATKLPVHVHSHCTSGIAPMTYLKAVEAGCDGIDTAISPLAMGTSQPATEAMYQAVKNMVRCSELKQDKMMEAADYFRELRRTAEADGRMDRKVMETDTKTLHYQIPGGMLSNLRMQMKEQGLEDRYEEVLREIPRVRKDLGEPPLVTPSSQIVGTQAIFNVTAGKRYKMISRQTKALLSGEYGQTARPFNEAVQKRVLGDGEPITCRPADLLEPEWHKTRREMGDQFEDDETMLSYILFPQITEAFLKRKGISLHSPEELEEE